MKRQIDKEYIISILSHSPSENEEIIKEINFYDSDVSEQPIERFALTLDSYFCTDINHNEMHYYKEMIGERSGEYISINEIIDKIKNFNLEKDPSKCIRILHTENLYVI